MMTTFDALTQLWNSRSPAWGIVLVTTFIYTLAALARGPVSRRQIACFVLSSAALVLALASPVAALASRYSFSAHMMQHLLLLLIVPLLALLAWPISNVRAAAEDASGQTSRSAVPLGWLAGVGAMWFWHIPALCTAAMQHPSIFAIQTASLVGAGAAFWWPVFRPQLARRMSPDVAILYLFSGCVGCSLLGIYVTFSPVSVCPLYMVNGGSPELMRLVHEQWGLTHRLDQQIGGLLMWVPACMVYLSAILATFSSWYRAPELAPQ
jgi:cytochrome c oxidase assembly factor CtaG